MRTRINERLARAAQYPVTLIVAPAGFGKTVALRDFLAAAKVDAVRYDVRREDATLFTFAHGFAEALAPVAPAAKAGFPACAQRLLGESDPLEQLAQWFAEYLRDKYCTIVIDDLHHAAADRRCAPLIVSLIERTAGRVNWIIATRTDSGLPVASWLAYGRIDVPIGEDELRFTTEEAFLASEASATPVDGYEIEALRQLTDGWPVAMTLALRTKLHAGDLQSTSAGTRELLYRYLAEQVMHALSDRQRAVLFETCVLPSFDFGAVDALGVTREEIEELRRDVSFLTESATGAFRYHDLFRDFLETELRRSGASAWNTTLERVGSAMESRGDDLAALRLYSRAHSSVAIARVLRRSGASLFERGEGETLEASLRELDPAQRVDAAALGVKAMLEAARGHFELAQRDFVDAIERAPDDAMRLLLVHRYAIELIRQENSAIELLEPYLADMSLPPSVSVPMLATFATALARAGRTEEAVRSIGRAIESIDGTVDDVVRARFYQQAAYVHHLQPGRGHAWAYANLAIELAVANGLYEVAARAYSVLYTIVYDDEDDPVESLVLLERLIECARKAGSLQTRLYGLMASFEIQVERGDDEAVEALEHEMERASVTLTQTRAETLLPARAMRAASEADFQHAFALLEGTGATQGNTERRALREAEIALYAYACGQTEAADAARLRAVDALAECHAITRRTTRTRVMLSLAELIRGHSAVAHRYISEAERAGAVRSRRLRSLVHAARAICRRSLHQGQDSDIVAALDRLRADQFGGVARMLGALPFAHTTESSSYALLTPSERGILAALARGASTKDIASQTARSAQTIDTHIRSICRKLQCSGRREAVALAMRSGWVET